jgi:Uri superfamily endonuclease
VLILRLPHATTIDVGRLGRFSFPVGWYAYVGSARGPGGLMARISRHLRSPKPLHWHIDYLRPYALPVHVWYAMDARTDAADRRRSGTDALPTSAMSAMSTGTRKRECTWARALSTLPGASVPIPRFGASDCRCPAHLVHFTTSPDLMTFARAVGEAVSEEKLND